MTTAVQELLESFESLSEAERQEAAVEILRPAVPEGDLSEQALVDAADALFCALDAEEATNAKEYSERSAYDLPRIASTTQQPRTCSVCDPQ
jgi:hypothetical protein